MDEMSFYVMLGELYAKCRLLNAQVATMGQALESANEALKGALEGAKGDDSGKEDAKQD